MSSGEASLRQTHSSLAYEANKTPKDFNRLAKRDIMTIMETNRASAWRAAFKAWWQASRPPFFIATFGPLALIVAVAL